MRIDYNNSFVKDAIRRGMQGCIFGKETGYFAATYLEDELYDIDGDRKLGVKFSVLTHYVKVPFIVSLENK